MVTFGPLSMSCCERRWMHLNRSLDMYVRSWHFRTLKHGFSISSAGRAFHDMFPRNYGHKRIDFPCDGDHTVCESAKKTFLCFSKDQCRWTRSAELGRCRRLVAEHPMGALAFCTGLRSFVYPSKLTESKSTKNRDVSFSSVAAARSALRRACAISAILESPEMSGGPTC